MSAISFFLWLVCLHILNLFRPNKFTSHWVTIHQFDLITVPIQSNGCRAWLWESCAVLYSPYNDKHISYQFILAHLEAGVGNFMVEQILKHGQFWSNLFHAVFLKVKITYLSPMLMRLLWLFGFSEIYLVVF